MKNYLLSLGTVLLFGFNASAQCCPYVDFVTILPSTPSDTDPVSVITQVTTPNQGEYLGYTVIESGNNIRIEACYYNGMFTALQTYTDTIELGPKPGGTYTLEFVAYLSGSNVTCTYDDSTTIIETFEVTSTLAIEEPGKDAVSVYPNPVKDGLLYASISNSNSPFDYKLYNLAGEIVLQGSSNASKGIDVSNLRGIYFLSLHGGETVHTSKVVIH